VRICVALIGLSLFMIPSAVSAQTAPPDAPEASSVRRAVPAFDRPVSWKLMLPNILSDQKHIWTFPARLAHGHDWLPTIAVLGTSGGLFALDPIEGTYFRRSSSYHEFNNIFSSSHTALA